MKNIENKNLFINAANTHTHTHTHTHTYTENSAKYYNYYLKLIK